MIKSFNIIIITFIIIIIFIPAFAQAAESSPSSSIQQKLEELKTSIASRAAKLKQEINKKLQNKVFMGIVQTKSTNSLTLLTKNETKNIVVNEDTIYQELNKPKSKFQTKTLAKDMRIAALGEIDDQGFLHAKKIVLLPKTKDQGKKIALWGQIISEEDKLLVLKTKDKKLVPITKTKINTPYKAGDLVIVTGYRKEDNILEATFLFVYPDGMNLRPTKK